MGLSQKRDKLTIIFLTASFSDLGSVHLYIGEQIIGQVAFLDTSFEQAGIGVRLGFKKLKYYIGRNFFIPE